VTLGKNRLFLLIQESDNIEMGKLKSISNGLSWHRSRLIKLIALRVSAISVKSTSTI